MTSTHYASPVPPYAPTPGPQDAPHTPGARRTVEGVVLDAPGAGRTTDRGPRFRHVPQKSLLLAGLLAAVFPPFGMVYGTIFGTIVMTLASIPVMLLTAGHAAAGLWPLCVVWAVWGAHATNQRRLRWASAGL